MSAQVFRTRICRAKALTAAHLRPSIPRSVSGAARAFSSRPPSDENPLLAFVRGMQPPPGSPQEPGAGRGHGIPVVADLIASRSARSLLARTSTSTPAPETETETETETEDQLLPPVTEEVNDEFLQSFSRLLPDSSLDIDMEAEAKGEEEEAGTDWASSSSSSAAEELNKTLDSFKRMPVFRGHSKTKSYSPGHVELPAELRGLGCKFKFPSATHRVKDLHNALVGETVVMHGYLTPPRVINKKLMFSNFFDHHSGPGVSIQVVSNLFNDSESAELCAAHEALSSLAPLTPVVVGGKIVKRESTKRHSDESLKLKPTNTPKPLISHEFTSKRPTTATATSENASTFLELHLQHLTALNSVSRDLIYTPDTFFPPEQRHLQLRTHAPLFSALRLRAKAASICRSHLEALNFLEVETPLLFKSTPEGAREFLVPTRGKDGLCYALPQSPQQYKQILMASGVPRYYQLAKCFRDEDLRADRQPEFTQLDLEMAFATGEEVMAVIEELLKRLWKECLGVDVETPFERMTWWYAMKFYGSDKPDLRFRKAKINEITSIVPHLVRGPKDHIDAFAFIIAPHCSAADNLKLLEDFRASYQGTGDDQFFSFIAGDPSSLDESTKEVLGEAELVHITKEIWALPGSIVVINRRKGQWSGGQTKLGLLRTALISKARHLRLIHTPTTPEFTWIFDFPLFTPSNSATLTPGQGQGGLSGLTSTHHPFTAPHQKDLWLLSTQPDKVRGEHYDIVVNGVELGGGSRRIHNSAMQRYILSEILKIPATGLRQFEHLLKVLDSGCPPHAGVALGFDRLVAMMQGVESVRDVIAFPKSAKGADLLVGSPSVVEEEVLGEYGLKRG